ncbi:MAG: methyl-accepting chemotaxis protein [Burkholderiales bacterium]|nr:methyl-accepting chemotaxis protein [Burkholderiales bacterium]
MKNFSAEVVLHLLIAVLLAAAVAAAGYGFHAVQQAQVRTVEAFQSGRELGAALGVARAADAAARVVPPAPAADQPPPDLVAQRQQAEAAKKQMAQATAAVQKETARLEDAGADQLRTVAWVLGILLVATLALAWRFRTWIRAANVRPMRTALQLVRRVSAGDLTASAEGMDYLHTRKVAEALEEMTASLRAMVGEVSRSARTVADTAAQIAQGNLDLSQRTEEQASTLEETASSMEELTSTVGHNAESARQASQLAASASETARQGGDAVEEVVKTMDDILDASRKISDIIGVIDSIAFQTNILALNAAVEAARAGEQGRGFAVVAAEVRNLAHRTTAAAKEIKGLIAHAERKVELGATRVDAAGHTMVGVVLSVKKVTDLIAEIAAASQEQNAGIGQVNTAVAQMEQVVQQNASLVEEAAAATESMKEQAQALLGMMSRFKLGDEGQEPQEQPLTPVQQIHRPAPIKLRPSALPPAYTTAIAGNPRSSKARTNGQWEEF